MFSLRRFLSALAAAAALFTLAAVSGCGDQAKPESVAAEFTAAVLNGDSDKVIKMLDFGEIAKKQHLSESDADVFKSKIKSGIEHEAEKVKANGGFKDLKADPAHYSNDKQSAVVVVSYKVGGEEKTQRVKLNLKDDKWVPTL
jgi:hypothetical protein